MHNRQDIIDDLLGVLKAQSRITLGDATRSAKNLGLNDDEAFLAVIEVARVEGLTRFQVDRSGSTPTIVGDEEIRSRYLSGGDFAEWSSQVEVVWAKTEAEAIGS